MDKYKYLQTEVFTEKNNLNICKLIISDIITLIIFVNIIGKKYLNNLHIYFKAPCTSIPFVCQTLDL